MQEPAPDLASGASMAASLPREPLAETDKAVAAEESADGVAASAQPPPRQIGTRGGLAKEHRLELQAPRQQLSAEHKLELAGAVHRMLIGEDVSLGLPRDLRWPVAAAAFTGCMRRS